MFITWLGHSCFKLQEKETIIVTDPYGPDYGLKPPRLKADIVTVSHEHHDHNYLSGIMGEPLVINGAGEYEAKGVYIKGINSWHDEKNGQERGVNTIYRFSIDGLSLVHLGDLGHILTDEQVEELDGTDILLVPVGGIYTLDGKRAVEVINQLEPRIVIPMHYDQPGWQGKNKLDGVNKFCKEIGICQTSEVDKLKISKSDLPSEEMRVIVMSMAK